MSKIDLGLESILRTNGNFFKELTEAVQRLRDGKKYDTKAIKESMIPSVIRLHTGINVEFDIQGGDEAYCVCYPLTNFNSILPQFSEGSHNKIGTIIEYTGKEFKGRINEVEGKVSGDFSKIAVPVVIGIQLINHDSFLTPEECAAVLIHECGHAFQTFQYMNQIAFGCAMVATTARNILDSDSYREREVLVKKLEDAIGTDKTFNMADLIENPKPGLDVVMVSRYMRSLPYKTLQVLYDNRLAEQHADTFVVRHGGAQALATGIDKIQAKYKNYGKANPIAHFFAETARLFTYLLLAPGIVDILFYNASPRRYDNPKDRIEYMKLQLIEDLKRVPKNDEKNRQTILSDIAVVEGLLNKVHYRRDVIQFFWDTVNVTGKDMKKEEELQKSLERMLYNDLFLKATQFKANRG